jgi:hypothetical protein
LFQQKSNPVTPGQVNLLYDLIQLRYKKTAVSGFPPSLKKLRRTGSVQVSVVIPEDREQKTEDRKHWQIIENTACFLPSDLWLLASGF